MRAQIKTNLITESQQKKAKLRNDDDLHKLIQRRNL